MRFAMIVLLAAATAGCLEPRANRPVVDLARLDGWVIVVPTNSIPSEMYAAGEFRDLVEQASGKTLQIVAGLEGRPAGRILIGQSAEALSRSRLDIPPQAGPEDLRIRVSAREIVISGGRPRGTLYGVYTFVEDYLGVRFLTADDTYVPEIGKSCPLPALERTYTPPIPWRYSYYEENHKNHDFAVRLRQNPIAKDDQFGGLSDQRLINHSVSGLLPWNQYGKEHPEYFCLRDGKRPALVLKYQTYEIQPCFSNPDARRIMLDALRAQIKREYPAWKDYSVSQDDNDEYCTCPDCAAKDAVAGCHTGQLLDFVNWVAGEIGKDYPDVTIGTLIYQWSRTTPQNMKPAANVKLQLCSIECCQIHPIDDTNCPLNKPFQKDMEGWAKLSDNIAVWNYNVDFHNYLAPCPNLFNLERNVRFFRANHARGIFMQAAAGTVGAEFSDLRNYMIGNLLWDPSRSGTGLMEEFLRLHYGASAPPIRRFIDRVHEAALSSGRHQSCFSSPAKYGLTDELARQGMADFREAMALAPDEVTRLRVEKASLAAWRLAVDPVAAASRGGKALTAEQKAELRPVVLEFLELCRKHKVTMMSESVGLEEAAVRLLAMVDALPAKN